MSSRRVLLIYADGACYGQHLSRTVQTKFPGKIALAWTIVEEGTLEENVLDWEVITLDIEAVESSPEAEWIAFHEAVRLAADMEAKAELLTYIHVDSLLVAKQYTGQYKLTKAARWPWPALVAKLVQGMKVKPIVRWVPREQNRAGWQL